MIDLDKELTDRQESIRAKRRASRERNKAKREEDTQRKLRGETSEIPVVNIKSQVPPEKSLKDRLLDKFVSGEKEEKPDAKRLNKTENLISHILPLALSGMLAVYSQRLFREEFRRCAPTKEEVSSILLPIFSVINRHIKLGTEVSQDALDVATALLASITVTTRMAITAQELRNEYGSRNSPNEPTQSRGNQNQDTGNIRAYYGTNGAKEQPVTGRSEHVRFNGNGYDTSNPDDVRAWEAQQVSELLRRDAEGRRLLGLAPRLRDED